MISDPLPVIGALRESGCCAGPRARISRAVYEGSKKRCGFDLPVRLVHTAAYGTDQVDGVRSAMRDEGSLHLIH
jgi:hypothetical protein